MTQKPMDPDVYMFCRNLYISRISLPENHPDKWQSMGDYLQWYNTRDVVPLVEALVKCFDSYAEYFHVQPETRLSLPGISFLAMFNLFDQTLPYVSTFANSKNGNEVRELFRKNVLGGLTNVFHR